jgi:hypothetical protein
VSVTGPTRELACLALGHDDKREVRCPATDERLMRELTAEVQRLRVAAGEAEETVVDRAEADGALDEAFHAASAVWATSNLGEIVHGYLTDLGWQLVPKRRP